MKQYLSGNPPSRGGEEHDDGSNIPNLCQFAIHTGTLVICNRLLRLGWIKEGTKESDVVDNWAGTYPSVRVRRC
jgi:hypothetical protein